MARMSFRCHLREHTTRCSIKIGRASISALFAMPFPSPSNTHRQRLEIRPWVCRIERTPSRTKRCQRWVLDNQTGTRTPGRSPCAWGATALRVHECKQQAPSSLAQDTHCLQIWHLALVPRKTTQVWSWLALHVSGTPYSSRPGYPESLVSPRVGQVLFGDERVKLWKWRIVSAAVRNSGLLSSPGMNTNERDVRRCGVPKRTSPLEYALAAEESSFSTRPMPSERPGA